jgi:hypothetical protein
MVIDYKSDSLLCSKRVVIRVNFDAGSVEPGTISVVLEDFSNSDYNPLALRLSSKFGVLHSPWLDENLCHLDRRYMNEYGSSSNWRVIKHAYTARTSSLFVSQHMYALFSRLVTEATPFACINCNKIYVTSNELIIFSMIGKYVEYLLFSEEYKIE